MNKVVELKRHGEPLVWACNCGCCNFRLYQDGSIICPECETPQTPESGYGVSKLFLRKD